MECRASVRAGGSEPADGLSSAAADPAATSRNAAATKSRRIGSLGDGLDLAIQRHQQQLDFEFRVFLRNVGFQRLHLLGVYSQFLFRVGRQVLAEDDLV